MTATPQQLAWQDMEIGMMIHYGPCTYGRNGQHTGIPANAVNPVCFDARQWVDAAHKLGASYMVLVAKHHDGFCLWPTQTTDYSIASSPWKGGKGDMVGEVAQACREAGLRLGLYCSPWDNYAACYPDAAAYDDYYQQQLTELLTQYGPLSELWFDGAGSEGRTYDWHRHMALVKQYQPDAMIFNMGIPTIRWAGNEEGVTPYPCWNDEGLGDWIPAECDASLRRAPIWFWEPDTDDRLYTQDELMDMYHRSVGHGANLLLNASPNRSGVIQEADVRLLEWFGNEIKAQFGLPLVEATGVENQSVVAMRFPHRVIRHAVAMEDLTYGEPIREWALEVLAQEGDDAPEWKRVYQGSALGHKHIARFIPVACTGMRLLVETCQGDFCVRKLEAFESL